MQFSYEAKKAIKNGVTIADKLNLVEELGKVLANFPNHLLPSSVIGSRTIPKHLRCDGSCRRDAIHQDARGWSSAQAGSGFELGARLNLK